MSGTRNIGTRKARLSQAALVFCTCLIAAPAAAGTFTCSVSGTIGYCEYRGLVTKVYVNDTGLVLLYLGSAFDLSLPANVGISGVNVGNAIAYPMSTNPAFADKYYAAGLTAQSAGMTVIIQGRDATTAGYLRADRIWVEAN